MPWVIWDIVIPLIVTFAIGLMTGWLLWRWRRYKTPAHVLNTPVIIEDEEMLSSASATTLIEERDAALARAEAAETNVAELREQLSTLEVIGGDSPETSEDSSTTLDEQVVELEISLADEKAAKAELEQAFMDLNNRYSSLSQKLDESTDDSEALVSDHDAELQRKHESAQAQIEAQEARISSMEQQHESDISGFEQMLAERDAELSSIRAENAEVLGKLEALRASEPVQGNVDTGNVHQLASYSRPVDAKRASSPDTAEQQATPEPSRISSANAPLGHATDARVARGVGVNAVAEAVSSENHEQHNEEDSQAEPDQPVAAVKEAEVEVQTEAVSAVATEEKPEKKTSNKTTASGYTPVAWEVPERTPGKAERDNLQQIKGVGPVLEKLLHKTGIFYFEQVAKLDKKGVEELDSQLPQFSGRIQRDKWVVQAKKLHNEKYAELNQ